ncbi:MAG: hypothetical protein CM1200mP20_07910 [Pseudomonadota bacterium]|nr:MAG: hypothetical protein CM1200mP20_07910 [Pseudomonadota bacterium]
MVASPLLNQLSLRIVNDREMLRTSRWTAGPGTRVPLGKKMLSQLVLDRPNGCQAFSWFHVEVWYGLKKSLQVGMPGPGVDVVNGAPFDHFPLYMTTTSWATFATTPRSCVISSRAMPSSDWRTLTRCSIWAWTVTSSAVVGSSAISRRGRQTKRSQSSLSGGVPRKVQMDRSSVPDGIRKPDHAQHLLREPQSFGTAYIPMQEERFAHLITDGVEHRQRHHRFLEDD